MKEALSLAELESYDPRAPHGGHERRFCCPFCGDGKPRDHEHRSLAINTSNGKWKCHRCNRDGLAKEWWTNSYTEKPYRAYPDRSQPLKPKFEPRSSSANQQQVKTDTLIQKIRDGKLDFESAFPGSPAADYLRGRGIDEALAIASSCGYAEKWEHWDKDNGQWVFKGTDRRVIFPVIDRSGQLVAISARAIDAEYIGPKTITRGSKSLGVFTTIGAMTAENFIITEAPIDGLSFAEAGFPAIATMGTSWPAWLPRYCAFRTVLIATDADEGGDNAAKKLSAELASWGTNCPRLRPSQAKDWNEVLTSLGVEELTSAVRAMLPYKATGYCPVCNSLLYEQADEDEDGEWIDVQCPNCNHFVETKINIAGKRI